jgi:hypothetical protein
MSEMFLDVLYRKGIEVFKIYRLLKTYSGFKVLLMVWYRSTCKVISVGM